MRRLVWSALVVLPLSLGPTAAASVVPAAAPATLSSAAAASAPAACTDAVVVAVPGAGEGGADNPGATLSALTGRLVARAKAVGRTATVEVVATETRGPGALRGRGTMRTAAVKAVSRSSWRGWRSGARARAIRVEDAVTRAVSACPEQLIYLAGYSQGAEAVHRYLARRADADVRSRTVAVVLVADPARVARSRGPITGNPRARRSAEGVTSRMVRRRSTPAVPAAGWPSPVHTVCTAGDVACDLGRNRFRRAVRIHRSYDDGTMRRRLVKLGSRYGARLAMLPRPAANQQLRPATQGILYQAKLQVDVARGSTGALRFHARSALPPGLSLTRRGVLQGTPRQDGTWTIDYTVRNRSKTFPSRPVPGRAAVTVSAGVSAVVSAGGRHSCEVRPDGTSWCWGANFYGQLGNGTTDGGPSPVQVGRAADWVDVSAGGMHSCGIRDNGTLWCWGLNYRGQLGIGSHKDQAKPRRVGKATSWESVSAGWVHTCATRSDGSAWCWGDNNHGQLGHGDRRDHGRPVRVARGHDWRDVNAGGWHSCGITSGGAAYCWGRNGQGQVGDGTTTVRINPARVGEASDWVSVQPAWTHTCGLRQGGGASCWGGNEAGQLGGGPFRGSNSPRPVGGDHTWATIHAGLTYSCGLDTQQALWCWGTGRQGQLGGTQRSQAPIRVHADTTWAQVDLGWLFACGLDAAGSRPTCWGNDETGELGPEAKPVQRPVAARKGGGFNFNLVSFNVLGSNHTSPRRNAGEFSPARVRAEWMIDYLRKARASVVGFQEIQRDQVGWFERAAGETYDVWPGTGRGMQTSIAYRQDVWRMVDNDTVRIPFIKQTRDMPLVRLQHRATGRSIWVMNIHNAPRTYQKQRVVAVNREIKRLKQVIGKGDPVFLVGDFNERDRAFCQVTGRLDFVAPRGGNHDGGCHPPRGFVRIDWIFGSKDVGYSRYREDKSALVKLITDHAVLRTRVTVP